MHAAALDKSPVENRLPIKLYSVDLCLSIEREMLSHLRIAKDFAHVITTFNTFLTLVRSSRRFHASKAARENPLQFWQFAEWSDH
jgi:hypothetical protein